MNRYPNPFKPSTGATPPVLVGREDLLDNLRFGILDGVGAPERVTLFLGARGVGKTVMLSEADDIALRHGWFSIDETATPGLIGKLDEHVSRLLVEDNPLPSRRITGVSLGAFGVTTELSPALAVGLRQNLSSFLDHIGPHSGLLVTLDEVQSGVADLREFAAIVQHLIREQRNIMVVMAGLPSAISTLLRGDSNDKVTTFLRRADKHLLADVPVDAVAEAFAQTFAESGRDIEDDALIAAAEATYGYPFLVQLIGHQMWRGGRCARRSRCSWCPP